MNDLVAKKANLSKEWDAKPPALLMAGSGAAQPEITTGAHLSRKMGFFNL